MRIETWKVALDALRSNKMRAFLTSLGVMIGSASIVLVVTVALTGKRYITAQIEGVGTNIVYANYVRPGSNQMEALSNELSLGDMEAARRIPGVVEVAGTRSLGMTVVAGGADRAVNMVGVTEGFQRIRNLVILRGRFFDADDMAARSKVCLLTEELAKLLFPYDDPLGKNIRAGELQFNVIGVFRERVSTFGQSEIKPESFLIPFGLLKTYAGDELINTLYAQAGQPGDVASVTQQLQAVLRSRHGERATYRVQNLTSLLEAAANISAALTVILLLVAFIALLISGIGIMNIMLVTVTQRTREIGVRKAIGAPRREILWQFLIEALVISGVGALAGIAVAVSLPILVRPVMPGNLTVPISAVSVVVAFTVSCLTGVLFGYLPASRAARLQPTESLRYE